MNNVNAGNGEQSEELLVDLHYLPCIEYFARLARYKKVVLEGAEHYRKQTYRNRARVLTPQKVFTLSVPVLKAGGRQLIREVKIDHSQGWLRDHWRTVSSSYGKAPFFPDYAPFFEKILFKKHRFLFDLNFDLLTNCLFLVGLKINTDITSVYQPHSQRGLHDLRDTILPDKKNIIEEKVIFSEYRQVFGNNFASNLTIIDLLFCQGPRALNIIRQSIFL